MKQKLSYWSYPQTFIVLCLSVLSVMLTGLKVMLRGCFGVVTREWVDELTQHWSKQVLKLARVKYCVVNPHHVKPPTQRPVILMCNHISLYDIPLSFLVFPNISLRMLAKKELSRVPFMGQGIRGAGFPCIDRQNRKQAIQDLQYVKRLLETGITLWIAPEGTRSKDGKLGPFKKGGFITAIEMKAVIIPIGIRGADKILPARTYRLHLGQSVEMHIGEPVDAADYTLDNKDQLIQEVRERMLRLVGEAP